VRNKKISTEWLIFIGEHGAWKVHGIEGLYEEDFDKDSWMRIHSCIEYIGRLAYGKTA